MIKKISLFILVCIFNASTAFSGVAKFNGTAFDVIASATVESSCGTNFVFRSQHKDQVPAYLEGSVIKESFKGTKFAASLADTKAQAKNGNKCIWFADAEKASL